MAVNSTAQSQLASYAPTSFNAGVGSGVRQAVALIGGAVETTQTIRNEARFIPRREPAPFEDKVEIRAPAPEPTNQAPGQAAAAKPAPAPEAPKKPAPDIRQLSLTGQPAADKPAAPAGRGSFVDVDA